MSIQQLLFATSSVADTGSDGLDFDQVGDSFDFEDGSSGARAAFCLGREPDYSYTSPRVIWTCVNATYFAKFELQNGTYTKVGGDIWTGFKSNLVSMTDTGTHIIFTSGAELNRYNKSTGSLDTYQKDLLQRRGVAWKSPFFYTGNTDPTYGVNVRHTIDVYVTQTSNTRYENIVNDKDNNRKGLVYDHEDDLFYQCFNDGGGTIFSTTNASSDTDSVSFTDEGTLPSWTNNGNMLDYDILRNKNGKFIIGKMLDSSVIHCLYKLA